MVSREVLRKEAVVIFEKLKELKEVKDITLVCFFLLCIDSLHLMQTSKKACVFNFLANEVSDNFF